MIVAVGTDLIDIRRVARALARHGSRFKNRCFTAREQADCDARGDGAVAGYAARFAVKEALGKCLGTGIGGGVSWRDIEFARDDGTPRLTLSGGAAARAHDLGIARTHVSLAHERDYAVALVVCEAVT